MTQLDSKVIAFEASILNRDKKTGVDYYTRNLIQAFQKVEPKRKIELLFLGFKKPPRSLETSNTSVRSFRFIPGRLYSLLLRYNLAPPIDLLCRSRGDIYIFPNFERWPLLRRKPSMVIIYDLSFIKVSKYAASSLINRLSRSVPRSIKKSERIIVISDNTKKEIIEEYNVPEEKISVVYPAVDHELFKPASIEDIEKIKTKYKISGNYILSLSTIEPRKNLIGTMNAYSKLPPSIQDTHSLILAGGKGWLDEEINARIKQLSSNLNISLIGYVDEKDLPSLYSGASVFVYPSFYEGWGMPIQEAMACGTPVITANNSSLPESGGNAAIYVDAEDTDSIARGIEKILSNKDLARNLTSKGLLHTSNFTWENSAKQLLNAINKATSSK